MSADFFVPEGDKNGGRHFRARSLSTRLRGRVFNSSVRFLRLVFPFLASVTGPPCLPAAFRFPLSAVHRDAPHRPHVPSDPLNSSLRSTSSWPPRRRRRWNRALPFAFTLRSGLAINRLRRLQTIRVPFEGGSAAFEDGTKIAKMAAVPRVQSSRRLPRSCRLVFRFLMVWDYKSPSTNNETTAVLENLALPATLLPGFEPCRCYPCDGSLCLSPAFIHEFLHEY